MKTFKLISLAIIENEGEHLVHTDVSLQDGLIINREDEQNRWVIEAFTSQTFMDYFKELQKQSEVIIQVKITKQSNEPAVFLTSVIDVNEIGSNMNVVFMGTIIDQRKEKIEMILENLIDEGFEGKELLAQFKNTL